MQTEQIVKYFDRLYDPGDLYELVAIKDGTARRAKFAYQDDNREALEALAEFENLGWNLYTSVLPLQKQQAGVYDRVWLDRDDVTAKDLNGDWPTANVHVGTSQTDEGFRWQRIWRLDEELTEDEGRSLIKRLAKAGHGDSAVHDPRRVLRIPGLTNHKRGTPTVLLDYHEFSDYRVSVDMFPVAADPKQELTAEGLMNMDVRNPNHVLGEWLTGADEGERARKAYVTARFLKSCGVEYQDALAIVNTGAKRSTPPLRDDEVIHAVESAYGK